MEQVLLNQAVHCVQPWCQLHLTWWVQQNITSWYNSKGAMECQEWFIFILNVESANGTIMDVL
jgi:hypothetical protein